MFLAANADTVFMIGTFVLAFLVLPMVLDRDTKVPMWSSVPTAMVLAIFMLTFLQLGMERAATGNFFGASLWTYVAFFRS